VTPPQRIIVTEGAGYRIVVDDDQLDLLASPGESPRRTGWPSAAPCATGAGDPCGAEAVGGPVLTGGHQRPHPPHGAAGRTALGRDRVVRRLAARARQHREVLDDLTEIVAEHPLRERPHAQLMLALDRRRPLG